METENEKMATEAEYEARKKNASSRYMEDTRKQYLLASNNEFLQALIEKPRRRNYKSFNRIKIGI